LKLARTLGVTEIEALGRLHVFWSWVSRFAASGNLARHDVIDIEAGSRWHGTPGAWVQALASCNLLELAPDGSPIEPHDWEEYNWCWRDAQRKAAERRKTAGQPGDAGLAHEVERLRQHLADMESDLARERRLAAELGAQLELALGSPGPEAQEVQESVRGLSADSPAYIHTDKSSSAAEAAAADPPPKPPEPEPPDPDPEHAGGVDPRAVLALWQELCAPLGLLGVRGVTDARREAIAALAKRGRDLAWFAEVFRALSTAQYARGANRRGWQVDFDWVIRDEQHAVNILEGKYDRPERAAPAPTGPPSGPPPAARVWDLEETRRAREASWARAAAEQRAKQRAQQKPVYARAPPA
jgi:hypothetical protein